MLRETPHEYVYILISVMTYDASITRALQARERGRRRDELHDRVLSQDWLELLPHIFMIALSSPAGACACLP